MKRKITAGLTGVLAVSMLLAGCQASKGLENDNIKIAQYKEVEISQIAKPEEVTDETVESSIQSTLEAQAENKEVKDRAVKEGDIANIDFTGKIDGKKFDGGSSKGYDLTIGSGSFIDGFEDSIIGHKVGDKFDWKGKFPEDYQNTDYAGKDVTFTIKVNKITEQIVPELTDELVAKLSKKSKTVDEYKKEVKQQLKDSAESEYNSSLQSAVWQEILNNTEVKKYPDGKKEEMLKSLTENYEQMAKAYGYEKLDKFLEEQMGMTREQFDEEAAKAAEQNVKSEMISEAIAKEEKIELDDKSYQEQLEKMVAQYGYESVDALKEEAKEEDLKDAALNNLVLEYVADKCIQKAGQ